MYWKALLGLLAVLAVEFTLMVAYCMRYHPLLQEMEALLKGKRYGETFQLSIWTEQHTQGEPGSWMHRVETLGGGQLFSHGCHYIDILLAWMGEPVEGTHLGTNLGTPWMEMEGTSNVAIKFANGALGYHFGVQQCLAIRVDMRLDVIRVLEARDFRKIIK